ncbi:protein of unknown function [endosymbiont DhMRE of Dentiscutata heterogama]|uniref:hypothetical protein n=1 Tax=endosymbiont DhMRE of Dentiscutata heterogama TaxID=1609546 RepID=UPI000629D9D3|nr:hypothetical protein [endosymbiont DhMRE of Dentiscutata heterogama]CFW92823.1 protein of unknown function [endosymbiont DhMRE of Dentiscutata heterogama]
MVKKIVFEKYSKYTEQQEEIMKEIEQLKEELQDERNDGEIIKNWKGESAQDAKRYLMKEIIANYCQKVSSLNYD